MCIFSYMSTFNVLFEQMLIIAPTGGRLGIGQFSELEVIGVFGRCAIAIKLTANTHLFRQFFTS